MRKLLVLLISIALSGCVVTKGVTSQEREFEKASALFSQRKFKEAITAYSDIAANSRDSAASANALFELGLAHAHLENPERNYAKALRAFEDFSKRNPDDTRTAEVEILIQFLKTIADLKKQNEQLGRNIQQLKHLDVKHEERRKAP